VGDELSASHSGRYTPGGAHGTDSKRGWGDLGIGLDLLEKRDVFSCRDLNL
jgi:hypothetical protein